MTARERLPNKRANQSFDFLWRSMKFTATIARFADGRLAEIFLTNGKVNTDSDTVARDSAVICSLALQFGADLDTIRGALLRDARGIASGPLGVALDMIAAMGGAA